MLRLVVLGDPIDHSFSPRLHTAALAAAGIDGRYEARRADAAGMVEAVKELRSGQLHGANVTMPHKRLAGRLADELGVGAARAGSVNTLVRRAGALIGESTDIAGIQESWGELPAGPALVLGGGGAAAAALIALEGRPLFVSTRRPGAAVDLVERTGVAADRVAWGTPVSGAVVVNATPLGMSEDGLPSALLNQASGLFDMPYGPDPTKPAKQAGALGIPVVTGLEMLVAQAALSFELWTGVRAPRDAMRAALESDHSAEPNL